MSLIATHSLNSERYQSYSIKTKNVILESVLDQTPSEYRYNQASHDDISITLCHACHPLSSTKALLSRFIYTLLKFCFFLNMFSKKSKTFFFIYIKRKNVIENIQAIKISFLCVFSSNHSFLFIEYFAEFYPFNQCLFFILSKLKIFLIDQQSFVKVRNEGSDTVFMDSRCF